MSEILVDVSVTENDILSGRAQHCSDCPVARAIARKVKSDLPVRVSYGHFSLTTYNDPTRIMHHLPIEVTNWIKEYDAFLHVEPFSFSLFLSEELVK